MSNIPKNLNIKFDPTNFNKNFESKDKEINKINNLEKNLNEEDIEEYMELPHKEPIENIIINIRDLFFQILDIIENNNNPIPFIFSSDKRQFCFALFLIIFGTLLLLLSTLMVSS
jgi:hypothetical protein